MKTFCACVQSSPFNANELRANFTADSIRGLKTVFEMLPAFFLTVFNFGGDIRVSR